MIWIVDMNAGRCIYSRAEGAARSVRTPLRRTNVHVHWYTHKYNKSSAFGRWYASSCGGGCFCTTASVDPGADAGFRAGGRCSVAAGGCLRCREDARKPRARSRALNPIWLIRVIYYLCIVIFLILRCM